MTELGQIRRLRKVLAAGALIGLAGCQQVPSRPAAPSTLGWGNDTKGAGTTITPAQEADVQISMGRAAEQQGNLDQAMAAYRAALERDQRRADAYARLAVLHDKQGKFRESAELYRKALAVQPGDPDIFCDMGYSFYLQRRWAEAEINLRQSIAINPDHQRAHNNLALLLVRDNRLEYALAEFRKAGNDPVQAHMNLAFALTTDQRWESARAEYKRALAIDPSCQLAKARLDQLKILVAKREPRNGAQRDPAAVTTETAAPSVVATSPPITPRDPAPVTATTAAPAARRGPDTPTATPEQSAPSAARRDPALLPTGAVVSPSPGQRQRPMTRVAIPSLPAESGALARLWWSADAPAAPPKPQGAHPKLDVAPSNESSMLPLLAIDSTRPTPAEGSRRRNRASIPPPRPFSNPARPLMDPNPNSTIGP